MRKLYDVWGYHPVRHWEIIDTFVDEQWARDFIEVYRKNICVIHERLELRKSEHVESFDVGIATKQGLNK